MKNFGKLAVLGAALAVSATYAFATPITAEINLGGSDSFDTTHITLNAAAVTLGTTVINGVSYPNFSAITFEDTTAFAWASESYAPGTVELFSGPGSISFYLTGLTGSLSNGGDVLTINGTGLFEEAAYTNTAGTFDLTSQYDATTGYDTVTSFSASALVPAIPEPNSLMLLGTGLLSAGGMLMRRRRLTA